jgi:hypothetical protein
MNGKRITQIKRISTDMIRVVPLGPEFCECNLFANKGVKEGDSGEQSFLLQDCRRGSESFVCCAGLPG